MRHSKIIDYEAAPIAGKEILIKLLCSPLYYDKATHIVSAEAFNLRMMGRNQAEAERYASLGFKSVLEAAGTYEEYLQRGYKIWDDKSWDANKYAGYGTFSCEDACNVKPERFEIHPLVGDNKGHVGLFYVEDENKYYRGPLPTNNSEILEMLMTCESNYIVK